MGTYAATDAPRDALPSGAIVRHYRIESVLGHGGFGIVYKARHKLLGHKVALKEYFPIEIAVRSGRDVRVRRDDCLDPFEEGKSRFLREARQLWQFRKDPGIVTCLEFFRANGTAYLVMDHEDGMPLSELLARREALGKPLDQADLMSIAEPLIESLSKVHKAGVLHRDIKPSNILIRREDGRPVLIDFGAAKQTVAQQTRSLAPYTEGYAAIEQLEAGEGRRLGPWTDLYGVGAVLWRMVAGGKPPWNPPNPKRVEARVIASARGRTDPLPTARKLGEGRFSRTVLDAVDSCLMLPESERIQDCGQLLRRLRIRATNADQRKAHGRNNQLSSSRKPKRGEPDRTTVTSVKSLDEDVRALIWLITVVFCVGLYWSQLDYWKLSDEENVLGLPRGLFWHLIGMMLIYLVFFRFRSTMVAPPTNAEVHLDNLCDCWKVVGFMLLVGGLCMDAIHLADEQGEFSLGADPGSFLYRLERLLLMPIEALVMLGGLGFVLTSGGFLELLRDSVECRLGAIVLGSLLMAISKDRMSRGKWTRKASIMSSFIVSAGPFGCYVACYTWWWSSHNRLEGKTHSD